MEEIEYKLKQNNTVLIVQAVSKLVEAIKLKKSNPISDNNGKNSSDVNFTELQLLKSNCGVENPTVSITASHGIVTLVEEGILPIGSTLSDLMVTLSTARCYTGITMAIGNLLLLDLRRSLVNNQKYKCPFTIHKPQHPLITVLSQNSEIWREIYNQMQLFIHHYDNKIVKNSLELLRPVFLYVLCNPASKLHDICRRQVWNLLILGDNIPQARVLNFEILTWIQVNSKQNCLELCDYLTEMSRLAIKSGSTEICTPIILYLTSLVHKLIKYGCDPIPCISIVIELLEITETNNAHSIILMILADTIRITPSIYLTEVLWLCKVIVLKQSSNTLSIKAIVASILQWLLYPSSLLIESLKIANEIISFIDKNQNYAALTGNLFRNIYFKYVQYADSHIDMVAKLCIMAEKWQMDDKHLLDWLEKTINTPKTFLLKIFSFISAVFIHDFDKPSINRKALEVLLKFVEYSKELSSNVLVLILHKLSRENNPESQTALLKAIPTMAILKENVPLVISTLETVKSGPGCLKIFSFKLYFELWMSEVRCFPYLQKMLLEPAGNCDFWEFGVAKSYTLKEICVQRPELHGKEMVSHLSQILNKFVDQKGSMASALAIEGIAILCAEGIVDIISTWKSLAPRFSKEKRPIVNKSLCQFFSEFSNLRSTSMEHEAIIAEVVSKLWYFVSYSENIEVIAAALKALSNFDLDQLSLKQLPDLYRQNLKLPSAYAKTPVDAARKPEDVLPYVPGECWVQLLQNINHDAMENAGNLLIEWIRIEIAGYRSNVYTVAEGRTEPVTYDYLPAKSIIRGLGNYIRLITIPESKVTISEHVIKECLRVLSVPYSKPLPPLDWSFLHDLLHKNSEILRLCINLACKQILISGSARRLIENYISVFEPKIEKSYEMTVLFSNLSYLSKGIAPNLLRPMIINSVKLAYENVIRKDNQSDETLFNSLVKSIKDALLVEDIHDANRTLIGQIIEALSEEMNANDNTFDTFLQCIVEVPTKYIERISSPSVWWETTQNKFECAIKVRCSLAKKSNNTPLVWLNECINTAATLPSVQIYTLRQISEVFCFHGKHSSVGDWILELMGQIQEKLTNENKDANEIIFLCDVFLLAIIVFTGHDCLFSPIDMVPVSKEAKLSLFPNALFSFVNERCQYITVQVMEWLYHMIEICTEIPATYQLTFCQSLTMLKHEKAFIEPAKWMKYVCVKRPNC